MISAAELTEIITKVAEEHGIKCIILVADVEGRNVCGAIVTSGVKLASVIDGAAALVGGAKAVRDRHLELAKISGMQEGPLRARCDNFEAMGVAQWHRFFDGCTMRAVMPPKEDAGG